MKEERTIPTAGTESKKQAFTPANPETFQINLLLFVIESLQARLEDAHYFCLDDGDFKATANEITHYALSLSDKD